MSEQEHQSAEKHSTKMNNVNAAQSHGNANANPFRIFNENSKKLKKDSTLADLAALNIEERKENAALRKFLEGCSFFGSEHMPLRSAHALLDPFSKSNPQYSHDIECLTEEFDQILNFAHQDSSIGNSETSSEPLGPDEVLDFIQEEIKKQGNAFGLPAKGVFRDWKGHPDQLSERGHDGGLELDSVIGLDGIPAKMESLFTQDPNDDRPSMGMLNAVSGAGKTTLFQYCERHFNQKQLSGGDKVALYITFNGDGTRCDANTLTADQGLAMRIAERFLLEDGQFSHIVRTFWKQSNALKNRVTFYNIILAVAKLLEQKQKKIFLFIDEPGLAGDPENRLEGDDQTLVRMADNVVQLTSPIRGNGNKDWYNKDDVKMLKKNVRIVVSSLTPVYDNEVLQNTTNTGGPIEWIDVPMAGAGDDLQQDVDIIRKVKKDCHVLSQHMHPDEFEKSMKLLVALASGHWRTLKKLELTANKGVRLAKDLHWLKTIYLWNVRDALVMNKGTAHDPKLRKATFDKLLKYTILQKQVCPFDTIWEAHGDEKSLVDLAYQRVVLNRFPADGATFEDVTPHLSLLDVRWWCHEDIELTTKFSELIHGILRRAGSDPTSPENTANSCKLGKAFESTAAYFLAAKLWAWKDVECNQTYALGLPFVEERVPKKAAEKTLFPGHTIVHGNNRVISIQSSTPRILQVKDSGFHKKKSMPPQKEGEGSSDYDQRRKGWAREARGEEISIHKVFGEDTSVTSLDCGDLLLPGSQNQPHSDALLITELHGNKKGLLFLQYKFSASESTTALSSEDIKKGLDNLLKERNVLFGNDLQYDNEKKNLIAALEVKEEDVIYCWSVLRKIPSTRKKFFDDIANHAETNGFEGTILISENNSMYGPTFKNLAVVLSGF